MTFQRDAQLEQNLAIKRATHDQMISQIQGQAITTTEEQLSATEKRIFRALSLISTQLSAITTELRELNDRS